MLIDLSNVQAAGELKSGTYTLRVESLELRETQDKTGQYLNARFYAEEAGENFFFKFHVRNADPQTQARGCRNLKAFLIAIGENPDSLDSTQVWALQGKRFTGTIVVKEGEKGTNTFINTFKKLEDVGQVPSFT